MDKEEPLQQKKKKRKKKAILFPPFSLNSVCGIQSKLWPLTRSARNKHAAVSPKTENHQERRGTAPFRRALPPQSERETAVESD